MPPLLYELPIVLLMNVEWIAIQCYVPYVMHFVIVSSLMFHIAIKWFELWTWTWRSLMIELFSISEAPVYLFELHLWPDRCKSIRLIKDLKWCNDCAAFLFTVSIFHTCNLFIAITVNIIVAVPFVIFIVIIIIFLIVIIIVLTIFPLLLLFLSIQPLVHFTITVMS